MTGSTAFHQLVLSTPRLRLRPLVASDAGALFDLYADREVMRYWSTPPWTTLAQAEALIAADLAELPTGRHLRLALLPHDREGVIGTCSLFSFNLACRRAEIGYALARNVWGQGLMHEALVALVAHAFGALQLHRLEADIDPRNTASAASLARLGFAKEGHLRERWIVDGVVSDSALYGLLRSDWLAQGPHSDAARNI